MKTGQRCEAARQLSEILDLIARLGPGLTPQGQARLHPLLADVAADVIEMLVETSNGPALKILDDRLRTLGYTPRPKTTERRDHGRNAPAVRCVDTWGYRMDWPDPVEGGDAA